MAKPITSYVCNNCGKRLAAYLGVCPQCHEYGTIEKVIETREPDAPRRPSPAAGQSRPQRLADVDMGQETRYAVSSTELARVLGGGIVPGSITLIAGDPGIGKSTLLLQLAISLAQTIGKVLYVSGEESVRQIKMRADRLGVQADDLYLVTESSLETILDHVQAVNPAILIVDSIQTTFSDDKPSAAGTVTQVRECAARFQLLAKSTGIGVFLVGHVTKEGTIAGPRVLEHIVDTVLYLEGDPFHAYRLLRSVKNRFGATNEVGVFEMRGSGLVEVINPSEVFLAERMVNASGSAILVTMEGTRPLLVEVQALASSTTYPNPRRTANGIDFNRLQLLIAVLTRRVGLRLADQDVFVNVIGGLTVQEPAADLAIAVAIASSIWDVPVLADLAIVGEVGLSGELRAVGQLPARLREAAKLGFRRLIVPKSVRRAETEPIPDNLQVIPVRTLREALDVAVPREKSERAADKSSAPSRPKP
ncbi:MAG: DNA repair protein RadA [Aggregatilineales bacterium]